MIFKDFLPDSSLKEYVQCYRIVHFDFSKIANPPVKFYPPKPENCLHFFLKGSISIESVEHDKETCNQPVLFGQHTSTYIRYNTVEISNFQIVFQPSALFRLTGRPNFELTNKHVDASYIFPGKINLINEQLQEAKTISDLKIIADKFISDLINQSKNRYGYLDAVINKIIQCGGNLSLDWLAKQSFISTRQFKRKFHERTGVNTKTLARIVRFNKAFNIKNANPGMDWLAVAIACGYYDYQHLVRDYKDFTGYTPAGFHIIENRSPECVLGLAKEMYKIRANLYQ